MKYNFDGKKGPQISFKLPGERRERVTVKAGETVEIEDRFVYAFERSKHGFETAVIAEIADPELTEQSDPGALALFAQRNTPAAAGSRNPTTPG